jgi:hypothetical protein
VKPGTPNLLSGAALPPTVQVPASLLPELPDGATLDVDETGQLYAVVDLTKVPRNMRRKALQQFRRVGEQPKPPRRKKAPSKRRQRVDEKEERMGLHIQGHEWALGRGGRTIDKRRMGNNLRVVARVQCECGQVGEVAHRAVLPADQLDKRMKQKGWKLDPPRCPDCVQQPKEERMATSDATVSAAAGLAQAKVFKLLAVQFEPEKGRYLNGYSDERIAKETGCAKVFVEQCRKECFGEIKEDPAVAELRGDVAALESLISETVASLQQQLASVKAKLAQVAK